MGQIFPMSGANDVRGVGQMTHIKWIRAPLMQNPMKGSCSQQKNSQAWAWPLHAMKINGFTGVVPLIPPSGFNNPLADGILDQFSSRMQVQLAHDVLAMACDSLGADGKRFTDLIIGGAIG
jgi:hypothetical protein